MILTLALPLLALLACCVGCQSQQATGKQGDYETIALDPQRNTEMATKLNTQATLQIDSGAIEEAEKTLKDALNADVMYGPAHNNLGLVYYQKKQFYLAAWEFNYASKLMPHKSEPRNNLGLVYEAVMRLEDAIEFYDAALSIDPNNPQIIGNAARARIRRGDKDDRTRTLLDNLILKDTREQWVEWAKRKRVVVGTKATDNSRDETEVQ